MLPDRTIEQCAALLDEDSDRWIWPYLLMPEGWQPPRYFNMNYDHWLIPVPFCQEVRPDATDPATWTTDAPRVIARPLGWDRKKAIEPSAMIDFHEWRLTSDAWIQMDAPNYKDTYDQFRPKHFELLPALKKKNIQPVAGGIPPGPLKMFVCDVCPSQKTKLYPAGRLQ